ncbi:MAG: hypothetical protein HY286_12150 [Planctomycetes bacterium]|nr:hypothetical protein [Planctomycetota bacterium]
MRFQHPAALAASSGLAGLALGLLLSLVFFTFPSGVLAKAEFVISGSSTCESASASNPARVSDIESARRGEIGTDADVNVIFRLPIGEKKPKRSSNPNEKGSIRGRVLDQEGKPVDGVTVTSSIVENEPPSYREVYSEDNFNLSLSLGFSSYADVAHIPRRRPANSTEKRSVQTGSDGNYVFDALDNNLWSVSALQNGVSLRAIVPSSVRPGSESIVDFVAEKLGEVQIDIRTPDGAPPAAAEIIVSRDRRGFNDTDWEKWTPGSPKIWRAPGEFRVRAIARCFSKTDGSAILLASEAVDLNIREDRASQTLTVALRARGVIRAAVNTTNGERWPAAVVSIEPVSADVHDAKTLEGKFTKSVDAGGEGTAVFMDLDPGTYVVSVARNELCPVESRKTIVVSEGFVECELQLPPVPREFGLWLTLSGPEKQPISRAYFDWPDQGIRNFDTVCLGHGKFWLPFGPRGEIPAAISRTLNIQAPPFPPHRVAIAAGQTEATVQIPTPAWLKLTVIGWSDSSGFAPPSIGLRDDGNGSHEAIWSDLRSDGTIKLGPVSAGPATVIFVAKGRGSSDSAERFPVEERKLMLEPGINSVSLAMPSGHSLRIRFPNGETGASVTCWRIDDDAPWLFVTRALGDGLFIEFDVLPAGRYRIAYVNNNGGYMDVSVPEASSIVFRPDGVNAYRVHLGAPNGLMSKIGLRTGDFVVAIDGQSFHTIDESQAVWASALAKSYDVTWRIVRGGSEFELKVPPSDMKRDLGGTLLTTLR